MATAVALDHGSPTSKLNSAISDFAASFVERELQQLTEECNEALGRVHVPKLQSLLLEVDKERQAFEDARKKMLQSLHKKLEALDVDHDTIESVIAGLQAMYPAYLTAIPSASVLAVRPPTPTGSSSSSDSQLSSLGDSVDLDHSQNSSTTPGMVPQDGGIPNKGDYHESPRKSGRTPLTGRALADNDVQRQLPGETSKPPRSQKRSRDEAFEAGDGVGGPSQEPAAKVESGFPTITIGDLTSYESVFQHSGYRGYYIIRCTQDGCASPHFTDPPLLYRRAVKHFEKYHNGSPSDDRIELTDNDVFLKYAVRVEGVGLASKDWFNQHIGPRPHKFTPRSRKVSTGGKQNDSVKKARTEPEGDNHHTPSRKGVSSVNDKDYDQESASASASESESGPDNSRRHLRRVPRQDYAGLVTGKPARAHTASSSEAGRASSLSASVTDETDSRSTPKHSPFKSPMTRIKLTDASKYVILSKKPFESAQTDQL